MPDFLPLPWEILLERTILAFLFGGIVGLEREFHAAGAGLRTNMLVSLGTATFVLAAIQSGMAHASTDALSRVIQGVATGVGFVGAGTILQRDRVYGLTSAAAVWVSAGAGIAAALGQWQVGLLGTVFALVALRLMKWLEDFTHS